MEARQRRAHAALLGTAVAGASVLAIFHAFPPGTADFYPQCPIHAFTGFLCPGCGGTRALAALSRGDIQAAMTFNAWVVILLPFLLVYLAEAYRRTAFTSSEQTAFPTLPKHFITGLLIITAVFTISRNLIHS